MQQAEKAMASVKKMEKDWKARAQKAQSSKNKIDDTVLSDINATMDVIYGECQTRKQASVDLVNARVLAVSTCAATKADRWALDVARTWTALSSLARDHKACVDSLCTEEDRRIAKYEERDTAAGSAHSAIPKCEEEPGTCGPSPSNCASCTSAANGWYENWFTKVDTLITEGEDCVRDVSAQHDSCKRKQNNYEANWCLYEEGVERVCGLYDECYTDTTDAYTTDTANMTALSSTNINVCYATKKIQCWLDVIAKCQGSADDAACNTARADCDVTDDTRFLGPCTTDFTVIVTPYPDPESCDRSTLSMGLPGTATWKAAWYDSRNEFHEKLCDKHSSYLVRDEVEANDLLHKVYPVVDACPKVLLAEP